MAAVTVGKKVPAFAAEATSGVTISTEDLLGSTWVIYFYPKDDTPGCTTEGQNFRDLHDEFEKLGVTVLGVSRDSKASHERFKQKHEFPFELVSDADEKLCKLFGVIKEKNMYGRKTLGVERSTFLVDDQGVLRREWRKVKVNGHAAQVLDAAASLGTQPTPDSPTS
jgi:peroxiredoxin Q/BCP